MIIDAGQQQDSAFLELVLFKAGQHRFGVEACRIRSSGPLPDYAIPPVEPLLSLAYDTPGAHRQCLTIKGDEQDYELSVAVPFELCKLPAEAIHPLPFAVTARCKLPGLRALAISPAECIPLIDIHSLLQHL